MTDKDLYTTLGVKRTASYDEIRVAYRQLAQVLHPDRQANRTESEVRFAERRIREINEAWSILSNTSRRKEYDYELERIERNERIRRAAEAPPNRPSSHTGTRSQSTNGAARPNRDARQAGSGPVGPEPNFDPHKEYRFDGTPIGSDEAVRAHHDHLEDKMTPTQAFILVRTPWIIVMVVLFIIFVMTAYVANDAQDDVPIARHDCVRMMEGRVATRVSCEIENDGRLVAEVSQPLDCPEGSRYVMVNERMMCATTGS